VVGREESAATSKDERDVSLFGEKKKTGRKRKARNGSPMDIKIILEKYI